MPRINVNNIDGPVLKPKIEIVEGEHTYGRHKGDLSTDEELKKVSSKSPLAMISAYPSNIHFAGQMDNEEIIILLRAHLVTNVPWILGVLLTMFVPPVLIFFLNITGFSGLITPGLELIIALYWYAGVFSVAFLNILYWYFNVGIITGERVVDIDWNSLTHRDVASAQISQLQDVRAVLSGVFSGLFSYGSIFAQTAGTEANIEFIDVPHAQLVVRKIEELMQVEEIEHEPK